MLNGDTEDPEIWEYKPMSMVEACHAISIPESSPYAQSSYPFAKEGDSPQRRKLDFYTRLGSVRAQKHLPTLIYSIIDAIIPLALAGIVSPSDLVVSGPTIMNGTAIVSLAPKTPLPTAIEALCNKEMFQEGDSPYDKMEKFTKVQKIGVPVATEVLKANTVRLKGPSLVASGHTHIVQACVHGRDYLCRRHSLTAKLCRMQRLYSSQCGRRVYDLKWYQILVCYVISFSWSFTFH